MSRAIVAERALVPLALVVAFLAVALAVTACGAHEPTPGQSELELQIRGFVPRDAISCGFVRLGSDATKARSCVTDAAQDKRAYWVASEAKVFDSTMWMVVFGHSGGGAEGMLLVPTKQAGASSQTRWDERRLPCRGVVFSAAPDAAIDCS